MSVASARHLKEPPVRADLTLALDWYALTVAPQREMATKRDLEERGQSIIVPMQPVRTRASRHARRIVESRRPLIAGYVFVGVDGRIPFEVYRQAKGYRDIVKFANTPAKVDRRQLQAILDLVEQMTLEPIPGPPRWAVGQNVTVFGRHATIAAVLKNRVRVLQEFLGSTREIVVSSSKLEAIPQEALAKQAKYA